MEQRDLTLIFQNANFDLRVLQGCGIKPRKLVHDTMIQSYLLTNGIPVKRRRRATTIWPPSPVESWASMSTKPCRAKTGWRPS